MSDFMQSDIQGWEWQDYLSTYRFWGLVLASFLMSCTSMASNAFLPLFLNQQGSFDSASVGFLYGFGAFGTFFGALLVLYFLRKRIKLALMIFALTVGLAALVIFSGKIMAMPALIALSVILRMGQMGFLITVIAAIVSGRPNLKSFLIPYSIVMIWNTLAQILAPASLGILANNELWGFFALPALLAVLALLPIAKNMFSEKPNIYIAVKEASARAPIGVFLLSAFIPFYFLYWIFNHPSELKGLSPEMKLPSRGGALMTALFAPYVLPIWFHNVRDSHKGKLPGRSATAMGIATFLFPAIAAAMAQSDKNALINEE